MKQVLLAMAFAAASFSAAATGTPSYGASVSGSGTNSVYSNSGASASTSGNGSSFSAAGNIQKASSEVGGAASVSKDLKNCVTTTQGNVLVTGNVSTFGASGALNVSTGNGSGSAAAGGFSVANVEGAGQYNAGKDVTGKVAGSAGSVTESFVKAGTNGAAATIGGSTAGFTSAAGSSLKEYATPSKGGCGNAACGAVYKDEKTAFTANTANATSFQNGGSLGNASVVLNNAAAGAAAESESAAKGKVSFSANDNKL